MGRGCSVSTVNIIILVISLNGEAKRLLLLGNQNWKANKKDREKNSVETRAKVIMSI